MVHQTDTAIYSVCFKNDAGEIKTETFETFANAAGCAEALTNKTRFLNVRFSNADGSSSISGSLYVYGRNNTRRVCNEYLLNQVIAREVSK